MAIGRRGGDLDSASGVILARRVSQLRSARCVVSSARIALCRCRELRNRYASHRANLDSRSRHNRGWCPGCHCHHVRTGFLSPGRLPDGFMGLDRPGPIRRARCCLREADLVVRTRAAGFLAPVSGVLDLLRGPAIGLPVSNSTVAPRRVGHHCRAVCGDDREV